MPKDSLASGGTQPHCRPSRLDLILLVVILVFAALPRFFGLGRWCFWYDEVVSMTLARQDGPRSLLQVLAEIDATRAPLHPLLLQGWLRLFGTGEFAGRALSAALGVATVGMVFDLARRLFDLATAHWSAWLTAICPILVVYSREARMYALLIFLTLLAWDFWVAFSMSRSRWALIGFGFSLVAMIYTHPLGLLMGMATGVATLFFAIGNRWSIRYWISIYLAAGIAIVPWIGFYFDHPPEFLSGRPSLKLLLGMPIGFVGGNSLILAACLSLIVWGMFRKSDGRWILDRPGAILPILSWLVVPPLLLFAYSLAKSPIFGPARYTVFVAPAYIILLARGIRRSPGIIQIVVGAGLSSLMIYTAISASFEGDQKADWRAAGQEILAASHDEAGPRPTLIVFSADPTKNVEVETARYYLADRIDVIPFEQASLLFKSWIEEGRPSIWLGVGFRHGREVALLPSLPDGVTDHPLSLTGLHIHQWQRER